MEKGIKKDLRFFSSWDDGSAFDLNLIEILKRYDLPAMFFIITKFLGCPGYLTQFDVVEISKNYEIGGHTHSHFQDLKILIYSELREEIKRNKEILEILTKKQLTQFCYPRGRYNDFVKKAVKNFNYLGARTTKVCKLESNDPLELNTAIHVFERNEYNGKKWIDIAKELASKASNENKLFHIWGHSAEIDKLKKWKELEDFFKWLVKNFNIKKEDLNEYVKNIHSK